MKNANPFLDTNPFAYFTTEELSNGIALGWGDLLKIWTVRQRIAKRRWEFFKQSGAQLIDEGRTVRDALPLTHDHNLSSLERSLDIPSLLERPELLIRPLMSIDKVRESAATAKVLTIGPRTEYEILILASYGFQIENITGLDMFTYSPWIEAGDMHEMSYEDNSFDIVFLGWVVSYSKNVSRLAHEVVRVAKPGAIVAIGVDYYPPGYDYGPDWQDRPNFSRYTEILGIFPNQVRNVFFQHEPDAEGKDRQGNLLVIFDVTKNLGHQR